MARKNAAVLERKPRVKTYSTPKFTQYAMYRTSEFGDSELVRVVSQSGDFVTVEWNDGGPGLVHLSTLNFIKRAR